MPKKIKTLKQKMRSDQRQHQIKASISIPPQDKVEQDHMKIAFDFKPQVEKVKPSTDHAVTPNEYKYLSRDLMKTVLFTFSIIIAELLIKKLAIF
jgi:hypothetical protein